VNPEPDPRMEIRPLSKGISRVVITLLVAAALAIYASNSITTLRQDPEVRARVEAFERMKAEARDSMTVPDSTAVPDPDSTSVEPDSL
jgi:hypothetical protein